MSEMTMMRIALAVAYAGLLIVGLKAWSNNDRIRTKEIELVNDYGHVAMRMWTEVDGEAVLETYSLYPNGLEKTPGVRIGANAPSGGEIRTFNYNGDSVTVIGADKNANGYLQTAGRDRQRQVELFTTEDDTGCIQVYGDDGEARVYLYGSDSGFGQLGIHGPSKKYVATVGANESGAGLLQIFNSNGVPVVRTGSDVMGNGALNILDRHQRVYWDVGVTLKSGTVMLLRDPDTHQSVWFETREGGVGSVGAANSNGLFSAGVGANHSGLAWIQIGDAFTTNGFELVINSNGPSPPTFRMVDHAMKKGPAVPSP
ncbi:MAG: hypothetical protein KDA54_00710 [Phycisphaerales bacterium]|nr:hypothetical protein [Phycisphaerales bacterium]